MVNFKTLTFLSSPFVLATFFWAQSKLSYRVELEIQGSLNELSAIFALILFSLIMVMSTRLSFLEKVFNSYDNIYFWHKFLGIGAFLLATLHAVLVAFSFQSLSESLSYIFNPSNTKVFLGTLSLFGILLLILLTYISSIPYSIWKKTHEWMGLFFIFGGLHGIMLIPGDANSFGLKIFSVFMAAVGLLSFLYIRFLWKYFGKSFEYTVIKKENKKDVIDIYLKPKNKEMKYNPGQFVFVTFMNSKGVAKESHPFSISSGKNEEYLRLSIKNLGDNTAKIQLVEDNSTVRINGPYGSFFEKVKDKPDNLVFIGGGIGITPFLSFLRTPEINYNKNIKIFYLAKNQQEDLYSKEIQEFAKSPNHNYFSFYSESVGRYFKAQDIVQNSTQNIQNQKYYICGPRNMMDKIATDLISLGVKKRNIFVEDFSFK